MRTYPLACASWGGLNIPGKIPAVPLSPCCSGFVLLYFEFFWLEESYTSKSFFYCTSKLVLTIRETKLCHVDKRELGARLLGSPVASLWDSRTSLTAPQPSHLCNGSKNTTDFLGLLKVKWVTLCEVLGNAWLTASPALMLAASALLWLFIVITRWKS